MKNLLIAFGITAFAAIPAAAAEMDFSKVDADASGTVSMDEAKAAGWEWSEDQFAAADTDGDGALSADEFAAATAG